VNTSGKRFGSTVTGSERADSDVDVAVLGPGTLSPEVRRRVTERLAEVLRRDVDLVDLRRASTVLRLQVVAYGQALPLGDADARGAFEDRVFSDYARLNEERREILAIYARRMPLSDDADLARVAQEARGCTGWDIENLCRKAAIVAVEAGSARVTLANFRAALGAITPWLTPDMEEGYRRIFREDCPHHYSF
jgi:SpoVK/Ycf46/Vps4 family AAA+-type ATPase